MSSSSRLQRVAVLVLEGAKPLDVGIPAQVFTTRASMPYEVRVCGAAPGLVTGGDGLSYHVAHGLDALDWADVVFLPGYRFPDLDDPPRAVLRALLAAHARGARLAAISTGAFALAATGLLDGRRATTHWHYTRALAAKHPLVQVDENVLFVDEGSVLTSAGAASGIDLCLHILRRDLGVAASNHAARRLVAAPYRSGGQAQYVPRSVPEPLGERFAATREWALHRLDEPLTLETMARHAAVSERTFSRRFVEDTGYTPMQWVMRARIDMARELLERSERGVEQIMRRRRTRYGGEPPDALPADPRHHTERIPAHLREGRVAAPMDMRGTDGRRTGRARPDGPGAPGAPGGEILSNHGAHAQVTDGRHTRSWWRTEGPKGHHFHDSHRRQRIRPHRTQRAARPPPARQRPRDRRRQRPHGTRHARAPARLRLDE